MGDILTARDPGLREATLIFHHIPKTAGSTLNAILEANYVPEHRYAVTTPLEPARAALRALPAERRRALRLVYGHGLEGMHAHFDQPCAYATLLRHPEDRVLSQFSFIRESPDHPLHAALMAAGGTLGRYLSEGINLQADNGQTRALAGGVAPAFGECTRERLEAAIENMSRYALVGLTERFDATLILARHVFGWRQLTYARRKVTRHRTAVAELSAREQALLRECNALDMELYRAAIARFQGDVQRQWWWFGVEVAGFKWSNRGGRRF